jgi:hypothetical protein
MLSWAWCCTSVILPLAGLREDSGFAASLGYRVRPCKLKTKKKKKKKKQQPKINP